MKISSNQYYLAQRALNKSTRHSRCPARAICGGRCTRQCPEWTRCNGGSGLEFFDHEHLLADESGARQFVSVHYGDPAYRKDPRLAAYCTAHGLKVNVVRGTFKGIRDATYVIFSSEDRDVIGEVSACVERYKNKISDIVKASGSDIPLVV